MLGTHGIAEVEPATPKAEGKSAVEELIELGEQIYGPHWINPLSRVLNIAHRNPLPSRPAGYRTDVSDTRDSGLGIWHRAERALATQA